MSYEAKSNQDGTYTVTHGGVAVPGASVSRISFPSITTHTLHGTVHHIAGPCVAKISVPLIGEIDDVSVTF